MRQFWSPELQPTLACPDPKVPTDASMLCLVMPQSPTSSSLNWQKRLITDQPTSEDGFARQANPRSHQVREFEGTVTCAHSTIEHNMLCACRDLEASRYLRIPLCPNSACPPTRVLTEDMGDPLRRPWPSSAAPLLLRAGVLGPPLPLLLPELPELMLRPRRARALVRRRSLHT
jgi:hypothetical protein